MKDDLFPTFLKVTLLSVRELFETLPNVIGWEDAPATWTPYISLNLLFVAEIWLFVTFTASTLLPFLTCEDADTPVTLFSSLLVMSRELLSIVPPTYVADTTLTVAFEIILPICIVLDEMLTPLEPYTGEGLEIPSGPIVYELFV